MALCHAFVRELPYYGEGRDIAELGTSAHGLFQEPHEADARETLIEKLSTRLRRKL